MYRARTAMTMANCGEVEAINIYGRSARWRRCRS